MLSKILNIALVILVLALIGNYIYRMPKYKKGNDAPDFKYKLIDGQDFTLSSLRGKYVLLDFWGSWCGPCRAENKGLVQLHNKFRKQDFSDAGGFAIVSVAVETNQKRWQNAIQQDGLTWPYHIAEFDRFRSPIVKQYGVKEIPTKYLIDPKGNIISTNPSITEIDTYLTEKAK